MHGILRTVTTLLLFATTLALPGAETMPYGAPAGHAAGCHGHGSAKPVAPATGFECCVNGHHEAIPNLSLSLRFVAAQVSSLDSIDGPGLALLLRSNSAVLVFPSNSPPGPAPLRI
jgi:hypothetical protein